MKNYCDALFPLTIFMFLTGLLSNAISILPLKGSTMATALPRDFETRDRDQSSFFI